jgi:hypothetical protein
MTKIPVPGNLGDTPTGPMQFQDDWPGLFIRGNDAIVLMCAINELQQRLADHTDVVVASSLITLSRYAEMIERDIILRRSL